jgi:hypothetical protein
MTSGLIRLSILILYDRIFSQSHGRIRHIVRGSMVVTAIYIIAFLIYPCLLCRPVKKFWKPFERAKYCGSNEKYWTHNAVLYSSSLILDLELLVLPIIPVIKLQMTMKKRLGVITLFTLGSSYVFELQCGRLWK